MSDYDPKLADLVRELNQAAGSQPSESQPVEAPPERRIGDVAGLDAILLSAASRGASDILLTAGAPPALRIHGELLSLDEGALSDDRIRALTEPLLTADWMKELKSQRTLDFSFVREGIGRFRTNLHYQRGTLAATIRLLPAEMPTIESLRLPPSLSELAESRKGLILVTGAAGSGKSSTLAALIDRINRQRACHIVTIEDPIEYRHQNRRAVVEQIEVGRDARGFAAALRSILRQSPDVILVGEIRDTETMSTAITAAETGHLVLATLHTNDAIRAIGRVVDSFPGDNQNQVRQQLSLGLLAVVAQQLVPSVDGRERFPAVEILLNNTAVSNLIRRGEDHLLRSQLSLGRAEGMCMMEESLAELARRGRIRRETAEAHASRPDELRRCLDR